MLVTAIEARPSRSLERVRVELEPGILSVVGPNGVGKTNLVEALYFALTGRSFRTSDRRDLIPFGESLARAEATVRDDDGIERAAAGLGQPNRGTAAPARRQSRRPGDARPRPPAGGGLLARSAQPDQGAAGRAPRPPRRLRRRPLAVAAELRQRFGQALAQRNAMISRFAAGYGSPDGARRLGRRRGRRGRAADRGPRARRSTSWRPPFAAALAELGLERG